MMICRAIQKSVPGFPRPLLNLSAQVFAVVIDSAFGKPLTPPFDPYANDINYLIASYVIPYVGLTGYVGANAKLQGPASRRVHPSIYIQLPNYITHDDDDDDDESKLE